MSSQLLNIFNIFNKHISDKYQNGLNSGEIYSILSDLKFIGAIKEGEKIDVDTRQIQSKNILTSFVRTFRQDTREDTFNFFSFTISRAFELIYMNYKLDISNCKNLISDINNCINGIKATQITYMDDRMFVCRLQTLIQIIETKMTKLRELYTGIFEDNTEEGEKIEIGTNEKTQTEIFQ